MGKEFLCRLQTDTFDLAEFRGQRSAATALAVEIDGEAMALISDLLNEPQYRRPALEHYGLVLSARDVNDFFFLCDTGQ